jgi:hypothetical protein
MIAEPEKQITITAANVESAFQAMHGCNSCITKWADGTDRTPEQMAGCKAWCLWRHLNACSVQPGQWWERRGEADAIYGIGEMLPDNGRGQRWNAVRQPVVKRDSSGVTYGRGEEIELSAEEIKGEMQLVMFDSRTVARFKVPPGTDIWSNLPRDQEQPQQ